MNSRDMKMLTKYLLTELCIPQQLSTLDKMEHISLRINLFP